MQKLVRESARELLEHLIRGRAAGEQPSGALELGGAQSVVMAMQRGDRRHDRTSFQPAQETFRLDGDQRLGFGYRLDAYLQVVLDDVGEVVDAVQEHVVELGHLRLDVARHGEIGDEHRRVSARLDRAFEHAFAQDRQ